MGAIIGRMGGGVNGANRLGCRGFGRGATWCQRVAVVFMTDIEKMCKAFTVVSRIKTTWRVLGDPNGHSEWLGGAWVALAPNGGGHWQNMKAGCKVDFRPWAGAATRQDRAFEPKNFSCKERQVRQEVLAIRRLLGALRVLGEKNGPVRSKNGIWKTFFGRFSAKMAKIG